MCYLSWQEDSDSPGLLIAWYIYIQHVFFLHVSSIRNVLERHSNNLANPWRFHFHPCLTTLFIYRQWKINKTGSFREVLISIRGHIYQYLPTNACGMSIRLRPVDNFSLDTPHLWRQPLFSYRFQLRLREKHALYMHMIWWIHSQTENMFRWSTSLQATSNPS